MAAPGGARPSPLLLLLLGLLHAACATFVVKNPSGVACVMANFSATVSVSYDTERGPQNTTLSLPPGTEALNTSSCGNNTSPPHLDVAFRGGHLLTLQFMRNATRYSVQTMGFHYSLADKANFPGASTNDTRSVGTTTDIRAAINTKYRCVSRHLLVLHNVNITLSDTTIQAYLTNGNFSQEESRCQQDGPAPTPAPPSPTPPPAPQAPAVSKYNISGPNGTCLLANLGLQLNVTYQRKDNLTVSKIFNINPNHTSASGNCSSHLVTLQLMSMGTQLGLHFILNETSSHFFLQGVQLAMTLPDARDPNFKAANNSLRVLEASLGRSYRCNSEQAVLITPALGLNLFQVWLQAFRVDGGQFGAAEECPMDENSMLIPIAVGGALAGLVLVVLIAYLIGRKRSHAGYQTI